MRKAAPVLYEIYITSSACGSDENLTSSAIKPEVVEVFKEREEKLIRFSQSIIDITSDLLGAFESGDTLDQSFMTKFKSKFDFFRGALPVVNETQPRYKASAPPPLSILQKEKTEYDDKTATSSAIPLTSRRQRSTVKKSPSHGGAKSKKRRKMREIDVHSLKFDDIVSDLYSKVHVVENLLIESLGKCEVTSDGLLQDASIELEHDKKIACAVQSAMSASSLSCTLAHLIVRRDKENQSVRKRESVANVLVRHDILGIVKRSRRRASIERMEPDTSDWVQLIATSMRNEGVVGFIESLRNFLPHSESFIQLKSTSIHTKASVIRDNLESDHDIDAIGDRNSALVLLEASQCLCESLYRLVVALGSTKIGREYLHSFGSELTSYTTKLLIQLPSDFSMYDKGNHSKSFTEDTLENTEVIENGILQENSTSDSNNGSYTERKNGRTTTTVDINDINPAISLRLWCILALTVLASHRSNESNTYSEHENEIQIGNGNVENTDDNNHENRCVSHEKMINKIENLEENEKEKMKENEKSYSNQISQRDHIQLLIVEDGALEWLNHVFFSLLMEILSAAFKSNSKVLEQSVGNDSTSIGMATLSLDSRKYLHNKVPLLTDIGEEPSSFSAKNGIGEEPSSSSAKDGSGEERSSSSATDGNSFSIISAVSDAVPQELFVLLELCLGMLVFAARSPRVQTVMTSTEIFKELSRSLLKTLFRLLLLPQLTQTLADGILVILNILFQDHISFRILARELDDLIILGKKIAEGDLKWFADSGPLGKLILLINSNKTNKLGISDPGSHSNLRILAESNKYNLKNSGGVGVVDVVTSLGDIALGKVIETQTQATDNTQLIEFLSRQKGFTGKINTSILYRYEDPSRNNYQPSAGSSDLGADDTSNSPSSSRFRSSNENKIFSLQNSVNTESVEAGIHD